MQRKPILIMLCLLLVMSFVSAGAVLAEAPAAPPAQTEVELPYMDPLAMTGDIVTAGSSTVFPLAERMAERFQDEGFIGNITIDSIGSGGGFERFCVEGETDVANASRPIRDSEVESCAAIGRSPIEFRVGTDALAVAISSENDFIENLTLEQLALAFSTAETWADVDPSFPAEPIQRFIPGTDSGTFDYFVEEVFEENEEPILSATNLQLSEDDNVLVQGITGSPYAIGFFGYAYFAENSDVLTAISVEGVEPNAANVDNNTYPLARPLFIYSDATIMNEKEQVRGYINFFLSFVNEEVVSVGYFPASDAALNESKNKWLAAVGLPTQGGDMMGGDTMMMSDEIPADMIDPLALTGDVVTAGSSTVFPLAERMAERFQNEGFGGNVTIDSIGSGGGFERFCVEGETDVANASRPIRDSEVESCAAVGRTPIEFRVGTDALAVAISSENDFIESLTLEQLALAFSTAETWDEVDSSFPAEPIQRFIPGTDSGTFDYFVEEIFDENEEPILAASNVQLSEDDNVLVQGITGSPYAIGFFGYAYFQENQDILQAISVEGVEPNAANVDNNTYPLARPLFIYSDATIMNEKPQVAGYIGFFLEFVNEEVVSVGYFPASDAALSAAKAAWLEAMGMGGEMMMEEEMAMDGPVELPMVDPLALTGDVVTAGSSTVFPLAERMAERFQDEGYFGNITIDSIGSGGGFERFCVEGETDVANASRPIRDSEVESCAAVGRTPIEFRVGTDALAVAISSENDFIESLTLEQLALAFSTAETWADVDPSFPAEPIQRFIPGTDSGTFDYFVEEVFEEDEEPILAASNLQLSEDDNVLVQGITGSPYAIGFFGYAYFQENQDILQAISVEGVEPNAANVDNNTYPLARPLFIYSDATIMNEKPQVAGYINFFLSFVNEEVVSVGYFPASEDALNGAKAAWLEAMGQ